MRNTSLISLGVAWEGNVEFLTTVHTFASGSSGNALLLSWTGGRLLVDVGISCRRVSQNLNALELGLQDLGAVLITHTHSDHISGLQTLLKKSTLPIWATASAVQDLKNRFPEFDSRFCSLPVCRKFPFNGCAITAIPTAHDAPGSCGYRFDTAAGSVELLTDTGCITPEAETLLPGIHLMILEANHDIEMLKSGSYPYFLKERILGPNGHLSNEESDRFAAALAKAGATEIVLAHLSRENNTSAMAQNAVRLALDAAGVSPVLTVAPREERSVAYAAQFQMRSEQEIKTLKF